MDLLNWTVLLKTESTLFNLLIRETSQFLCFGILLNMTYVAYKNAFFREMQFWSHGYTVVSYQALLRLSVYKTPAVYLSGAKKMCAFARSATLVPRLTLDAIIALKASGRDCTNKNELLHKIGVLQCYVMQLFVFT